MTSANIRMGLQIPSFTFPGVGDADLFETIAGAAVAAERAGFDSVYVMDHFYQLPMIGRIDESMFEAYTLLAAIAARTERVRLGCMVGGMTYRNPAFLAKQVTALDVISRGRAIWGIGAGWFEQEHLGYGYEFGTFTDRFEKLEEGLQIVKSMFVNETTTFEGKWFTVRDALNVPKPVTPGGPPVLIGGSGEKKTLRMVAQYGDACNVFGGPEQIRHLMDVLDGHCERLGRDPKDVCRTRLGTVVIGDSTDDAWAKVFARYGVSSLDELPPLTRMRVDGSIVGDADTVCERVQALLDAGLDGMVISLIDAHDPDSVTHAGEVLSRVLG